MPLVSTGWRLVVTVYDTSGTASNLTYNLKSADATAAAADTATVIANLTAITKGAVGQYILGEVFEEDALTLPANSENAIKASISVYLAEVGNKRANIKIPSPVDTIFAATSGPGYNTVNGTAAAVANYIQLFQDTAGVATISDGQTVRDTQPFAGGKRISRGSQNP